MPKFLYTNQVRIFDYAKFAEPLRERVREQAAWLAARAEVTIEHISKSCIRKEAVVAKSLEQHGQHAGLVHIISAMEACDTYKPWHDKQTHKTYVRPDSGKCLHYCFYHGRRAGPDLPAGSHMGAISAAILLQRSQSSCTATGRGRHRLQHGRQRLHPPSLTGNARRTWPMDSHLTSCTECSTDMSRCVARCSRCSARPIIGD